MMLFLFLFSTLLILANGQRIVPGTCPSIQTDETFNSVKFLGTWIETEKTPSIFDFVMRCLEVDYKQEKGGSLNVNLRGVSLAGMNIAISGDGVIHDSNRNGVYNVRYVFGVPFQGTLMTVIDTDYEEYAVLYSCTNSILPRVFHTEYIWILTRNGVLSNPSRQNIYTKLDSLKINRNQLQLSDRIGCPATNASKPAREEPQSNTIVAVPLASYVKNSVKPILAAGVAIPQTNVNNQSQSNLSINSSSVREASAIHNSALSSQPAENSLSKDDLAKNDITINSKN